MEHRPSELIEEGPIHSFSSLQWSESQKLPIAKGMKDAQAVLLEGKLYVRGFTPRPKSDTYIYIYDVTTSTWQDNFLVSPTVHSALTTYQKRLLLVGGYTTTCCVATNSTEVPSDCSATPDLSADSAAFTIGSITNELWVMEYEKIWTQSHPPMLIPRLWASAVSVEHNLIVAGGSSRVEDLNAVEVYNGSLWARAQSLPIACSHMSSTIHNGRWYLVGGTDTECQESSVIFTSLDSLVASSQSELTEQVWKTLPMNPYDVSSIVAWSDYLVAAGQGMFSCIDIVAHSHTQCWVEVGYLPGTLMSTHVIMLPTGDVLAIGGEPGVSNHEFSRRVYKASSKALKAQNSEPQEIERGTIVRTMSILEKQLIEYEEKVEEYEEKVEEYEEKVEEYKQLNQSLMAEIEQLQVQNELLQQTIEERVVVPTQDTAATGRLHGVNIIEETSVLVTNEAQTFQWAGYGLLLFIPPSSLPPGMEQTSIEIKAILAGQFKLPENTTLMSAVYSLHSQVEFSQPITVWIQHCATPNDTSSLCFARASHETAPYRFTALEGGLFPPDRISACIHLKCFSLLAIIIQGILSLLPMHQPKRRYCAQIYYSKEAANTWRANFVITHNLEACITAVKERYTGAVAGHEFVVTFEGDEIALDVPEEGSTVEEWTISPMAYPGITKEEVDSFKLGQRLPSCELQIKWNGKGELAGLSPVIKLKGAKQPRNYFRIALQPESTEGLSSTAKRGKRKREHEGAEEVQMKDEAGETALKRSRQSRDEELAVSYSTEFKTEPELPHFMNLVAAHIPSKWRLVGIQLYLKDSELDCIEAISGDPMRCFSSVFTLWKKKETRLPLNWWTVLQALQAMSVDEQSLAKQIGSKLVTND